MKIETEKRLKFASRYLSSCYQFYRYKHKLKSSHPFKFVNNRKVILIFNDYELKTTKNWFYIDAVVFVIVGLLLLFRWTFSFRALDRSPTANHFLKNAP